CLAEFSLQRERVGDRDALAGCQALDDLDCTLILASGFYGTLEETLYGANEHYRLAVDDLHGGLRHQKRRSVILQQRYVGSDKRARSPDADRIGNHGNNARSARIFVQQWTDEHDLRLRAQPCRSGGNAYLLSFFDGSKIGWRNGQFSPHLREIDN